MSTALWSILLSHLPTDCHCTDEHPSLFPLPQEDKDDDDNDGDDDDGEDPASLPPQNCPRQD